MNASFVCKDTYQSTLIYRKSTSINLYMNFHSNCKDSIRNDVKHIIHILATKEKEILTFADLKRRRKETYSLPRKMFRNCLKL